MCNSSQHFLLKNNKCLLKEDTVSPIMLMRVFLWFLIFLICMFGLPAGLMFHSFKEKGKNKIKMYAFQFANPHISQFLELLHNEVIVTNIYPIQKDNHLSYLLA